MTEHRFTKLWTAYTGNTATVTEARELFHLLNQPEYKQQLAVILHIIPIRATHRMEAGQKQAILQRIRQHIHK